MRLRLDPQPDGATDMSTTATTLTGRAANKAVVQRFFSAFNDQTPDVFDEIISPDYVDYGHEPPGRGPQGARDDYDGARNAVGKVEYVIDDMIAEGDRVATRWTATMPPAGGDEGRAASDPPLTVTGISIYVLANGQITETRHEVNVAKAARRLRRP
jgi:predicted ester cyclase